MKTGTAETYRVYTRTWYQYNEIGQLVPGVGRSTTIARRCTYAEARQIAQEYNRTHNPGPRSRKAEFTTEG